jgi:hypothetical protein
MLLEQNKQDTETNIFYIDPLRWKIVGKLF